MLGTYKTVKFTGSDQNPSKYSLESMEIVVSGIFFHGLRMRNKNNVLGLKMCVNEFTEKQSLLKHNKSVHDGTIITLLFGIFSKISITFEVPEDCFLNISFW